jgi:hypothetical protein
MVCGRQHADRRISGTPPAPRDLPVPRGESVASLRPPGAPRLRSGARHGGAFRGGRSGRQRFRLVGVEAKLLLERYPGFLPSLALAIWWSWANCSARVPASAPPPWSRRWWWSVPRPSPAFSNSTVSRFQTLSSLLYRCHLVPSLSSPPTNCSINFPTRINHCHGSFLAQGITSAKQIFLP